MKHFWKNKRILITGHEGFLGSHLTKTLYEKGARIIGLDRIQNDQNLIWGYQQRKIVCLKGNLSNDKLVKTVIAEHKPQYIFHLAAEAIVSEGIRKPISFFKSNIQGTWNILEACRNKKYIEAIIVASSDKAYGNYNKLPYKESYPLAGSHPYDVSKSCTDLLSLTYFHSYGLPIGIVRCGNIFGPGDLHFSRIVPGTIRAIIKNKPLIIRSNGKFLRDYVYVNDVVAGYVIFAEKMKNSKLYGNAFNISTGRPISVLDLVKLINHLAGQKAKYVILNQANCEIKHQYLSYAKAKKLLKWEPLFDLKEALLKTMVWYKKYYKK